MVVVVVGCTLKVYPLSGAIVFSVLSFIVGFPFRSKRNYVFHLWRRLSYTYTAPPTPFDNSFFLRSPMPLLPLVIISLASPIFSFLLSSYRMEGESLLSVSTFTDRSFSRWKSRSHHRIWVVTSVSGTPIRFRRRFQTPRHSVQDFSPRESETNLYSRSRDGSFIIINK